MLTFLHLALLGWGWRGRGHLGAGRHDQGAAIQAAAGAIAGSAPPQLRKHISCIIAAVVRRHFSQDLHVVGQGGHSILGNYHYGEHDWNARL